MLVSHHLHVLLHYFLLSTLFFYRIHYSKIFSYTRACKPHLEILSGLQCHTIVVVSYWLATTTYASISCNVFPTNMNRLFVIFFVFIIMRFHFTTFKFPLSQWILHPRPWNFLIENKVIYMMHSWILKIVASWVFMLRVPISITYQLWSIFMNTNLSEIDSWIQNQFLCGAICYIFRTRHYKIGE